MIVGVPKEITPGETRVALAPDSVSKLVRKGLEVVVESGAGLASGISDADFESKGARIESDAQKLWADADLVLKVNAPEDAEINSAKEGAAYISLLSPLTNHDVVRKLADRRISAFSLDMVPRITRAQSMDVLSSMSTVAGYKAVLMAADALPKMFPLLMTAAGTIKPARVFVIGAGVAGLQAIATAKRLGAVVSAFDTRPAVREQVESLGGKFVQIDLGESGEGEGGYARQLTEEEQEKQRQLMAETVEASDVVVTTALVPGKPAPRLIEEETVKAMKPGSVIVDMAAETGGNCACTEKGKRVVKHGVTICGELNLPATIAVDASQMFGRNVTTLVLSMIVDGELVIDLEDEVVQGALITHEGGVINKRVAEAMGVDPVVIVKEKPAPEDSNDDAPSDEGDNDGGDSDKADDSNGEEKEEA